MMHAETPVPTLVAPGPVLLSNGALIRTNRICGLDSDAPKLLIKISHLHKSVQGLEACLKAKRANNKRGQTKKRRALEPLMNGASNDAGRSTKRIKKEEQQETKTMDL